MATLECLFFDKHKELEKPRSVGFSVFVLWHVNFVTFKYGPEGPVFRTVNFGLCYDMWTCYPPLKFCLFLSSLKNVLAPYLLNGENFQFHTYSIPCFKQAFNNVMPSKSTPIKWNLC